MNRGVAVRLEGGAGDGGMVGRDGRWLGYAATAVLLSLAAWNVVVAVLTPGAIAYYLADDYTLYMRAATRWLAGGPFYEPWQLVGPYHTVHGAILYPPVALLLFAPFTVLPPFLWWAVPMVLTAWAIWHLRPAPLVWPALAACLLWPVTPLRYVNGNPVIWVTAAAALGCVWSGPAVLVLIKPSLFPFALVGIQSRRWWLVACLLALVSIPFGTMWLEWLRAVIYSDGGLLYSLQEVPIVALPVIAWVGRRRPGGTAWRAATRRD